MNGSIVANRSDASSYPTASTSATFEIGGCVSIFVGFVGEIIVFDRYLKAEEQQAVENYLGKKWGITVN